MLMLLSNNPAYVNEQYNFNSFFNNYCQPCSFKDLICQYNRFAKPTTVGEIHLGLTTIPNYVKDTTFFNLCDTGTLEANNFECETIFHTPLIKALYCGFLEA